MTYFGKAPANLYIILIGMEFQNMILICFYKYHFSLVPFAIHVLLIWYQVGEVDTAHFASLNTIRMRLFLRCSSDDMLLSCLRFDADDILRVLHFHNLKFALKILLSIMSKIKTWNLHYEQMVWNSYWIHVTKQSATKIKKSNHIEKRPKNYRRKILIVYLKVCACLNVCDASQRNVCVIDKLTRLKVTWRTAFKNI